MFARIFCFFRTRNYTEILFFNCYIVDIQELIKLLTAPLTYLKGLSI